MRYALGLSAAALLALAAVGCPNYDLDGGPFACASASDCRADEECGLEQRCCKSRGKNCSISQECCSLACHQSQCVLCLPEGEECFADRQCCSNRCVNEKCAPLACRAAGAPCDVNSDCCSRDCNGTCRGAAPDAGPQPLPDAGPQPLPDAGPVCVPPGGNCSSHDCCTGTSCKSNMCCLDQGAVCTFHNQCCTGYCNLTGVPFPTCN